MSGKKFFFDITKTLLTLYRTLKNLRHHSTALPAIDSNMVVILGTGPSLKETLRNHVDSIAKHDLFAVNKFCTRSEYVELEPVHYILLDTIFSTKVLSVEYKKLRDDVFDMLLEKTTWPLNLYIPSNTDMKKEIDAFFSENPLINIVYFNMTTVEGIESISFKMYEKGYGMPFAGNVLGAAILLSINMGYKKVILTGADMSMHAMAAVNENNELCLEEVNFYDKKNECKPLGRMVHDYYFMIARTFESFVLLKKYADFKGATIYNGSTKSFIDAFEKKGINDLLVDLEK